MAYVLEFFRELAKDKRAIRKNASLCPFQLGYICPHLNTGVMANPKEKYSQDKYQKDKYQKDSYQKDSQVFFWISHNTSI